MRYIAAAALVLGLLHTCSAATETRPIQPFSELDLCIPFNVRIENSAAPSAYSVVIDADQDIIDGITTNWSTASQYFTPFDFTQPGALNIQGRGNFQTANPVQITVQVPPNTLQIIDVTTGTRASFAPGFKWTENTGLWNVPSGATLLAPDMAIAGPITMLAGDSPQDPPYNRGSRIVWTNANADKEPIQAVSLRGAIELVINPSPSNYSFYLYPRPDLPTVVENYANITLAVDLAAPLTATPHPGVSNTYTYTPTRCSGATCATRVVTGSYPSPGVPTVGDVDVTNTVGDYIPARVATPAPWSTCTTLITNYFCAADYGNQTCDARIEIASI